MALLHALRACLTDLVLW